MTSEHDKLRAANMRVAECINFLAARGLRLRISWTRDAVEAVIYAEWQAVAGARAATIHEAVAEAMAAFKQEVQC